MSIINHILTSLNVIFENKKNLHMIKVKPAYSNENVTTIPITGTRATYDGSLSSRSIFDTVFIIGIFQ